MSHFCIPHSLHTCTYVYSRGRSCRIEGNVPARIRYVVSIHVHTSIVFVWIRNIAERMFSRPRDVEIIITRLNIHNRSGRNWFDVAPLRTESRQSSQFAENLQSYRKFVTENRGAARRYGVLNENVLWKKYSFCKKFCADQNYISNTILRSISNMFNHFQLFSIRDTFLPYFFSEKWRALSY